MLVHNSIVLVENKALKLGTGSELAIHLVRLFDFRRADGAYAMVRDCVYALRGAGNGKPVRMIGAMTDITERSGGERLGGVVLNYCLRGLRGRQRGLSGRIGIGGEGGLRRGQVGVGGVQRGDGVLVGRDLADARVR